VSYLGIISGVSSEAPAFYRRCHVGYGYEANNDTDPAEDWADMFMNWVYDGYSDARQNAGFDKADDYIAAIARRKWADEVMRGTIKQLQI
jgi:hypothetical protein